MESSGRLSVLDAEGCEELVLAELATKLASEMPVAEDFRSHSCSNEWCLHGVLSAERQCRLPRILEPEVELLHDEGGQAVGSATPDFVKQSSRISTAQLPNHVH